MMLQDLQAARKVALDKADSILKAAETAKRPFTENESTDLDATMAEIDSLNTSIARVEKLNTLSAKFPKGGVALADIDRVAHKTAKKVFSAQYADDFFAHIASSGREIGAALYEGSSTAGGYAVPIVVDDQIVPLAPNELAIRRLATVIPTTSDIKFPTKAAFGTAASKAESGGSTNNFAGTAPTLGQFTLSAFMAGTLNAISWELAQDVPAFQAFLVDDMITDLQVYEEGLFVSGSGTSQAQGLIGNVGSGVTLDPDANGNPIGIAGVLDLIGTLKAEYLRNATFVMARGTSTGIRKAQVQSNLFEPAWTRSNGQDYLFGYPVEYSSSMPAAARGNAPLLFGDFKRGYIIGDRGGAGINVKVLDQPLASAGQLQLLTYRRTDGRVRRSEAIQQYNVTASGTSSPE